MMYIHRPYFWIAISKYPDAPHRSEFWHSVIMAYRSAATLVTYVHYTWKVNPQVVERWAPIWLHAQSAALVLAALVIKSPTCTFASEAMRRFEETYQMLLEAKGSYQPMDVLASMQKLRDKAQRIFSSMNHTASSRGLYDSSVDLPTAAPIMDSLRPPTPQPSSTLMESSPSGSQTAYFDTSFPLGPQYWR